MKIRPLIGLMVVILLFGAYTSAALPSQSEYNGGEIKADALENQTPKVYTMKIYVGGDTSSSAILQNGVKSAYGISSDETESVKEFVSNVTSASEPKSPRIGKFLQGLISSILDSDSSGSRPLDLGSALDLGDSGGVGVGSSISGALDKIQTLSEILSIFSSALSAI
jgi:hypothetical protein